MLNVLTFLLISNAVSMRRDNPMSLAYLLNPDSNPSTVNAGGGPNGGPNGPPIAIVAQQGNINQDQDAPTTHTNLTSDNQFNYTELGNKIEDQRNSIIQERLASVEANSTNPSGRQARITEVLRINDLQLTGRERLALQNLTEREDFPANFSAFKRAFATGHHTDAVVCNKRLGYDLINYIKTSR